MASYTYVLSPTHNIYPNITVYDKYLHNVFEGWEIRAHEGYAFYDTTEENYELDPNTMEQMPVTYYYTIASKPKKYNWNNFHYVAVPRDSVDENYIFGGNDDTEGL